MLDDTTRRYADPAGASLDAPPIRYASCVIKPRLAGYVFDPEDPRAPTHEQWTRMSQDERSRVVEMLPTSLPTHLQPPPEGDPHRKAKQGALGPLDDFFRHTGRKVYLSSELAVFYPGEPAFAPDLLAVLDAEPHDRMRWVVDTEGKGLDLVIEVHVAGDRLKDHELNVERYARLGIREYFIFDRARVRLHGFSLPLDPEGGTRPRTYQRLVPQAGRYTSAVLGLDLVLDGDRLRFFAGNALLEDADETIARLGVMLDKVISREEEAQRRIEELASKLEAEQRWREEEQRMREEEQRKREEEQRKREEAERLLAEAQATLQRLKR
jgi:Uma2 family endonuclease